MIRFDGALALLDIEGTVSPLAYVQEVLHPFARNQLVPFLERRGNDVLVQDAVRLMVADVRPEMPVTDAPLEIAGIVAVAHELMERDAKQTGLKQLQGLIWEEGFTSGQLQAVVFPDVPAALAAWVELGLKVRIFSSGSVHAQRLFFRHTSAGDLSGYLSGHHDTTTGSKRAAASYVAIASHSGVAPREILYVSDITAELDAAREAGCATALAVRPGNAPAAPNDHPVAHSFDEIVAAPTSRL